MWYKTLQSGGHPIYGSGRWSLPTKRPDGTWTPGEWMPVVDNPALCVRGYHATDIEHVLQHYGPFLYELEYAPDAVIARGDDKVAGSQARLLRQIETWNERNLWLLACDFAERVLPIYEARFPGDDRPRRAIEVRRRYEMGQATLEELANAYAAAADAAANAADADAAYAVAGGFERAWQVAKLREMLGVEK